MSAGGVGEEEREECLLLTQQPAVHKPPLSGVSSGGCGLGVGGVGRGRVVSSGRWGRGVGGEGEGCE